MFLNRIKIFLTKNNVKKSLDKKLANYNSKKIETIGIIVDETEKNHKEEVLKSLLKNGFTEDKVYFLVFKDKTYKNEIFTNPTFSYDDFLWNGTIIKYEVTHFIDKKLDLLINYYNQEKVPLLYVSNLSNADFKVGFSEINNKMNHLILKSDIKNHSLFINELFKYLDILKKI
jgi:hypothetical protein